MQTAIIIGGGPAGLTAAYELLTRSGVKPIVFEATRELGGLARTVNYKGNRIDIGGHRFFSKSDRVMNWWQDRMPPQTRPSRDDIVLGRPLPASATPRNGVEADPERIDRVMLIRGRLSRIFYLRKFFDYPVALNFNTVANLGAVRIFKTGVSYVLTRLFPIAHEKSLEDFFINRFGRELYRTFFKDYTEKVWGVPCGDIKPEWGAQRIKGLSVTKALLHAARKVFTRGDASLDQKNIETSLIERFLYPKLGPGQMWEETANLILERGGEIHMGHTVVGMRVEGGKIVEVTVRDEATGLTRAVAADHVISTMPVRDLVAALGDAVPAEVASVARGLMYRDFMTVGLLLKKLAIRNQTAFRTVGDIVPDNWIYIQEPDVKIGRLQIFNNWSPYMVSDPDTVWVGLEYFCNEGDELWSMPDAQFAQFGIEELAKISIIDKADVLDSTVIRAPKAYPAYFGTYDSFDVLRTYFDTIDNLFLVGRNGMHKYNNQDHSMLTAMTAVDNIIHGVTSKDNIWAVNTEQEYHEEKGEAPATAPGVLEERLPASEPAKEPAPTA
ncbi:MAG: NAD(P)/FAD-dependent oxidoreductase [Candidatus Sericytochromatia bacterium]|nr:NAD(P)/FAD-dependent oxidoreductase [Candidatus Tanganyikabacteria bacterium]